MKDLSAIPLIASFIHPDNGNPYQVKIAALNWLTQICHENETVSQLVVAESHSDLMIPDMLHNLMSQSNTHEMQFYAAKCMTHLYRSNAIRYNDDRLLYRTLPTLILLCKKDKLSSLRAQAAEQLAYLTELDLTLQRTASICDQLVTSLSDMLRQSSSVSRAINTLDRQRNSDSSADGNNNFDEFGDSDVNVNNEIRQAAFKAFASLGANDEEIRKRIIETENLMDEVMSALEDSNFKVKLAALCCLHSLSRSVQQLRTHLQDHTVWLPLKNLLQSPKYEVLFFASSTLCNLLLEFSPSKQVNSKIFHFNF